MEICVWLLCGLGYRFFRLLLFDLLLIWLFDLLLLGLFDLLLLGLFDLLLLGLFDLLQFGLDLAVNWEGEKRVTLLLTIWQIIGVRSKFC